MISQQVQQSSSAISKQLDDLIAYVLNHFARKKENAGYERNKAEYGQNWLLPGVGGDLQAKFHAGKAEIDEAVGQLLKGWLAHIPTFMCLMLIYALC
jgi:hemerythrin